LKTQGDLGRQSLEVLDSMLVQYPPFGDSDYIRGQMQAAFHRRLQKVAVSLPVAGDLADALDSTQPYDRYRTYGDPVVRAAVQHSMRQLVTGAPYGLPSFECEDVFRETLRHLGSGDGSLGSPLQSGPPPLDRLGPGQHHGSIWSDDGSDRIFPRTFRRLVQDNFGDAVGSPNQAALDALRRGVRLIEEVLPSVARSALSHVHVVALFPSTGQWKGRASCSQYRLVGTVFLQRKSIEDPWWVAEHLLHEALHQKVYDLRHAHSLFASDLQSEEEVAPKASQQIVSIWNVADVARSNHWGISRSVVALHVYAHLALFGLMSERREEELEGSYGRRSATLTSTQAAFERAHYLASAIRESYWQELGLAGQGLIDWLEQFLDLLGPAPSRDALHLNLMLERHRRESKKAESLWKAAVAATGGDGGAAASLNTLVVDELATTRRALASVNATTALGHLEADLPGFKDSSQALDPVRAREARELIAGALSGSVLLRSDAVEQDASVKSARQLVKTMFDRSSERLSSLFAHLEAEARTSVQQRKADGESPTTGWDARATLLRLTDVLGEGYGTEEFCLFLYTIVRMHAPKTVVELGTGRGASAFWMALGARRNGLGHVWSVDDHEQLGEIGAALRRNMSRLAGTPWERLDVARPDLALLEVSQELQLTDHLTFIERRIRPEVQGHFDDYPFVQQPIDLLFSDFSHGPSTILQILGQLMPRMSKSCSILIDSASTSWPSYLLLEHLVTLLNYGQVPELLQENSNIDLTPIIRNLRITLVHLTKWGRRNQNSTAWLKFEPVDLQPHPRAVMRGLA
jgi:hypothetical protein